MKNAGEVQERSAGADRLDRHALDIIPENADPEEQPYGERDTLRPQPWIPDVPGGRIAEVAYLAGFSDQGHLATPMKEGRSHDSGDNCCWMVRWQ